MLPKSSLARGLARVRQIVVRRCQWFLIWIKLLRSCAPLHSPQPWRWNLLVMARAGAGTLAFNLRWPADQLQPNLAAATDRRQGD